MTHVAGKIIKIPKEGSFYTAVVTLVAFAAFPFYWMLITTFRGRWKPL
jgi:multiple sugar transport system permease protein